MSYSYLYLLSICIQILQLSSLKKYKITSDEHKEISRLKISSVNDREAIRVSWKSKHKIRGDRWRPAKNPSMAKLVFLEFQV